MGRHTITILDKKQQDGMRKVCRLAREVLDIAAREVKPGVTTDYIDEVVHKACLERDVCYIPSEYTTVRFTQAKILTCSSLTLHLSTTSASPSLSVLL